MSISNHLIDTPLACIWLVDDDEEDLMLLQTAFGNVAPGVCICTLDDGEAMLNKLEDADPSPNLILLDLNMSGIGGLEALRQMRSAHQYDNLPVVVLTTSTNPADKQQSTLLGANDFYTKPDSFQDLTHLASTLALQWLPHTMP